MPAPEYRVRYRTADSDRWRTERPDVLVALPISEMAPARLPNNHHGQQHRVGWYFAKKVGRLLPFESGLERLRMMCLDFDPAVSTFAAQPFSLLWDRDGKTYTYTPDLLVVRPGQSRSVEDVKPLIFRDSTKNRPAFEAARAALEPVGLSFECWTPPHPTVFHNIRYLAGYRRTPSFASTYTGPLLDQATGGPRPLSELAQAAGPEAWTRPVLYHLLWTHRLHADLERPLSNSTLIQLAAPGGAP